MASINVTPTSLADIDYPIMGGTVNSPAFGAFTVTPTYCVITYDYSVNPALIDPTSISFDSNSRIFTITETDFNNVGSHVITVTAKNHLLEDTGSFSFTVTFQDLCESSSISVTASSSLNDINYEIGIGEF